MIEGDVLPRSPTNDVARRGMIHRDSVDVDVVQGEPVDQVVRRSTVEGQAVVTGKLIIQ